MNTKGYALMTVEERMEAVLCDTFLGIHHCPPIKKHEPGYWTVNAYTLATFDFDNLTRLVLSAHHHCIRAQVSPGGPKGVKISLHARCGRDGGFSCRHPGILQHMQDLYGQDFGKLT